VEEKPKEIVRRLVAKYISEKPSRIILRLDWNNEKSSISVKGNNLDQTVEHTQTMDFTSFAHGVLDAYREAYGELEVIPISFREEIYRNDEVSLDLYPTGSAGIFDIFVRYNQKNRT